MPKGKDYGPNRFPEGQGKYIDPVGNTTPNSVPPDGGGTNGVNPVLGEGDAPIARSDNSSRKSGPGWQREHGLG